jgi:gliding motility-associated-like protein
MKSYKYFLALLFLLLSNYSFSQEICNNGKDDDGDGLIDLQDPDCQCHFNVTGNLLQNGSFELHNACPTTYLYSQENDIANFWKYGSYTNFNEAIYYHNFNCPYDSGQVMRYLPPALPLPDGNAFMSITQNADPRLPVTQDKDIVKVYIAQCLQVPLVAGLQYTLSFSAGRFQSFDDPGYKFKLTPFTVAIFGNADCNAVPFGAKDALSNGCPANYNGWQLLGKTSVISKGKWVQNRINFTVPSGINVIEIGPDCSWIKPNRDLADSTTFLDFYVYDLDDLHLMPTKDFHFQSIQSLKENPCDKDSVLSVPFYSNSYYQWYKDSIAVIGAASNNYRLPIANPKGNYNVVITNADSCLTSQTFTVIDNPLQNLTLPPDTSICENDSLLLAPPLDGVIYSWNGNTEKFVKIFNEGIYEITAAGKNGCTKNFKVNVHSQNCSVFIPNAFTPNGDGKNDLFRIPTSVKIDLETFSIYDRWGNKVFVTNERNGAWDGTYNGSKGAAGSYIFIISGKTNNKKTTIKGLVTLIR